MAYLDLYASRRSNQSFAGPEGVWGPLPPRGPAATHVKAWPWEVATSSTSPPAKLICFLLKDAPAMEPLMKVTLVLDSRETHTVGHTNILDAPRVVLHVWLQSYCNVCNCTKVVVGTFWFVMTQMPAAGVSAGWSWNITQLTLNFVLFMHSY